MRHSPVGSSQRKTDTVARAMDILKDRPMPTPKPVHRENYNRKPAKPAPKPSGE